MCHGVSVCALVHGQEQITFWDEQERWNDPLLWWKQREGVFPHVARLARILLAIPATSAPSERLFSKASLLLSKKKARVNPANAAMALFLQGNIDWHEEYEKDNQEGMEME